MMKNFELGQVHLLTNSKLKTENSKLKTLPHSDSWILTSNF